MMSSKVNDIHFRRGQLLERIANQRESLKRETLPAKRVLDRTDTFLAYSRMTADMFMRHLDVALIAGVILLLYRPRVSLRWTRRAFLAWRFWRRLERNMAMFSSFLSR